MLKKDQFALDKEAWCNLNQPDCSEEDVDIVIFGIPYDKGVSYRGGAAEGPDCLRQNAFTSTPYTEKLQSIEELKVLDAGNFCDADRDELFAEIEDYVEDLVRKGIKFSMVGGDHSVTIPVERGVNKALDEEFGIIHIDAHFDLCDALYGDKLSHGSTERRALEMSNIGGPENLYFIGIRSIEPDEFAFKAKNDIQVKTAYDCFRDSIEFVAADCVAAMSKYDKVYLTFDIDALDPGYAAGTGTPQFGGLTPRMCLTLLETLFRSLNIIGFDIVEVAPALDPSLTAMFAARKLLTEMWGYWAEQMGKLK